MTHPERANALRNGVNLSKSGALFKQSQGHEHQIGKNQGDHDHHFKGVYFHGVDSGVVHRSLFQKHVLCQYSASVLLFLVGLHVERVIFGPSGDACRPLRLITELGKAIFSGWTIVQWTRNRFGRSGVERQERLMSKHQVSQPIRLRCAFFHRG